MYVFVYVYVCVYIYIYISGAGAFFVFVVPVLLYRLRGAKFFVAAHGQVIYQEFLFEDLRGLNILRGLLTFRDYAPVNEGLDQSLRPGREVDRNEAMYETDVYTYPPINIYSISFKKGILDSKQLVHTDKH